MEKKMLIFFPFFKSGIPDYVNNNHQVFSFTVKMRSICEVITLKIVKIIAVLAEFFL